MVRIPWKADGRRSRDVRCPTLCLKAVDSIINPKEDGNSYRVYLETIAIARAALAKAGKEFDDADQ